MNIELSCTHCFDENDFKILELLQELDTWPSIEYISLKTGISKPKVKRSVIKIRNRQRTQRSRERLMKFLDETEENTDD